MKANNKEDITHFRFDTSDKATQLYMEALKKLSE